MRAIFALIILTGMVFLQGCDKQRVIEVPECEYYQPPQPEAYLKANQDERLVMVGQSYAGQLRKVSDCNATIQKINAKNNALFN